MTAIQQWLLSGGQVFIDPAIQLRLPMTSDGSDTSRNFLVPSVTGAWDFSGGIAASDFATASTWILQYGEDLALERDTTQGFTLEARGCPGAEVGDGCYAARYTDTLSPTTRTDIEMVGQFPSGWQFRVINASTVQTYGPVYAANTMAHCAIVVAPNVGASATHTVYIDGILQATFTRPILAGGHPFLQVLRQGGATAGKVKVDWVALTKGMKYTSNFTPPTLPP